jgi:exportin-T
LNLRPLAIRFLEDEYDDTSLTVIPFLQSILGLYKKEKKRAAQAHLTQEKADFLVKLLETTFSKLRYFTDEEWGGDDDDDDGEDEVVTAFLDMRRVSLKFLLAYFLMFLTMTLFAFSK